VSDELERNRPTTRERDERHRRKETTYKCPYSLFISHERIAATEMFSMGREEAWMFREEEGVHVRS
jgi:hypothetical protein